MPSDAAPSPRATTLLALLALVVLLVRPQPVPGQETTPAGPRAVPDTTASLSAASPEAGTASGLRSETVPWTRSGTPASGLREAEEGRRLAPATEDRSHGLLSIPGWDAFLLRSLIVSHMATLDPGFDVAAGRLSSPTLDAFADAGDWIGTWKSSLPYLVAGTAVVGGLTEGGRGLAKGGALLAGVLAGSMGNEALNRVVGRERPLADEGAYSFRPLGGHASFPSGHTAYAFSIAAGIDAVTDGWIPASASYAAATLTGLSRIYHGKHWLSDVAVGAFVGAALSHHTTRTLLGWIDEDGESPDEAPRTRRGEDGGPSLQLLASPGFLGVGLRF